MRRRKGNIVLLLTLKDLRHRVVRFAIVTAVAAIVFALLFLMNGLVEQFHREPTDTTRSFRADAWVLSAGVSGPFTSSASVPLGALASVKGEEVSPLVVARSTLRRGVPGAGREVILVGHQPGQLGTPRIVAGTAVAASGEAVVDRSTGARVGENVAIGRERFTVVGLTSNASVLAGVPLVYVSLPDAQDLAFGSRSVVSGFLVRGNVDSVGAGLSVHSNRDVAADTFHPLENAISSIDLVRALLWFVAIVVIGAVVFLSALERRRDFAVLKAVGARDSKLAGGLAIQAVVIALVGVAVAACLQVLLRPAFPMRIRVPASDYWRVPLLAAGASLVAAAAAMRAVVRTDPAAAFSGAS